MLTQEYLKSVFLYDPETGEFTRKKPNKRWPEVGTLTNAGYLQIYVKGKTYLAHRLAWLYMYGEVPKELDHINTIRTDNRIANLRESSRSENQCNRLITCRNKAGVKGLSKVKKTGKWQAFIGIAGKSIYLGVFDNVEEGAKALEKARELHHGEFANHG